MSAIGASAMPALVTPLVADIQRFSLDNGPGIRTTVFLKGCDLRCAWCHNPQLQDQRPQIVFLADRCIACRACVSACRDSSSNSGSAHTCSGCGQCADVCPTGALRTIGTYISPERLASLLLDDLPFFDSSGGGVTFSGGEPALFSRYCGHTARILKSRSIHLAIQTAGMFPWDEFSQTLLPLLDLVYFDLKALHVDDHKRLTGRDPGPIIENFRRLAAGRTSLIATMVLVPGVSDDPGSIEAMRRFVYGSGVTRFEARPYNAGGRLKRWRPVTVPLRLDPMASMPKQL